MSRLQRMIAGNLMGKVVMFVFIATFIPAAVIGYLAFSGAQSALRSAVVNDLKSARDQGKSVVVDYLDRTMGEARYLTKTPSVQHAFKNLNTFLDHAIHLPYAKSSPDEPVHIESDDYKKLDEEIDPVFRRFLESFEAERAYKDVLLVVNKDLGLVLYTTKKLDDLGASLAKGELKDSHAAEVWRRVVETGKPATADFAVYPPAGRPSAFVGAPVFREAELVGVLLLRFGPERINEIMVEASNIGETGDSLLLGEDLLLRSNSKMYGPKMLEQKVSTNATRAAVEGKAGAEEIIGMRGAPVLTAWAPLGLKGMESLGANFDWFVIAKMDSAEAFGPIKSLGYRVLIVAVVIVVVVIVAEVAIARRTVKSVVRLSEQARSLSEGDLTGTVKRTKRSDEIGALVNSFATMAENLRGQISQVLEGVNVLSSSAREISTTVDQVAAGAHQTSSAVSETTATVEEVKQAAKVSNDRAKEVSQTSEAAARISDSGLQATAETTHRMNLIKEQMESIGETVVRLSDHSKTIEEIVSSVQDLADQSNLLAVNASIEAARAGDQGKGFAVVAHEIKSLADQSREATEQIRTILEDTQKWVGAVVMATEQGGKAVDAGVQQADLAGESIRDLAKSVNESSQAASVINTSTEQQFVGVDQVANAMVNIEQAMKRNLDGTQQLQTSAQRLEDLGMALKQLVERYRV